MREEPRDSRTDLTPPSRLAWDGKKAEGRTWQIERSVERVKDRIPSIGDAGLKVSSGLHTKVLNAGEPARRVVDMLHGTWLGHPLHPVLTDLAIGAWTFGVLFDATARVNHSENAAWAADRLIEVGTLAAAPTALSGVADFSTIPKPSAKTATLHGLLNVVGVGLNVASIISRRSGRREPGRLLSLTALGVTAASGLLGGLLVYGEKVGVDHSEKAIGTDDWVAVMDENELSFNSPVKAQVNGTGVLLYRDEQRVYAIGSVCSHAGGNLDQGSIADGCVSCPLHDSVFRLRDGSVVHGPATRRQPAYETRIQAGKIEIRSAQSAGA